MKIIQGGKSIPPRKKKIFFWRTKFVKKRETFTVSSWLVIDSEFQKLAWEIRKKTDFSWTFRPFSRSVSSPVQVDGLSTPARTLRVMYYFQVQITFIPVIELWFFRWGVNYFLKKIRNKSKKKIPNCLSFLMIFAIFLQNAARFESITNQLYIVELSRKTWFYYQGNHEPFLIPGVRFLPPK